MNEEEQKTFKIPFKDQRRIINKEITLLDLVVEKQEEIERLNKELQEFKDGRIEPDELVKMLNQELVSE